MQVVLMEKTKISIKKEKEKKTKQYNDGKKMYVTSLRATGYIYGRRSCALACHKWATI